MKTSFLILAVLVTLAAAPSGFAEGKKRRKPDAVGQMTDGEAKRLCIEENPGMKKRDLKKCIKRKKSGG